MEENEFIPVDNTKTKRRPAKKTSKSKKSSKPKKGSSVFAKIDTQKLTTILGSFFLLFSIFLFLACVSYLFTWQQDQDKLINASFFV